VESGLGIIGGADVRNYYARDNGGEGMDWIDLGACDSSVRTRCVGLTAVLRAAVGRAREFAVFAARHLLRWCGDALKACCPRGPTEGHKDKRRQESSSQGPHQRDCRGRTTESQLP
jgi:hypothetical protein